MSKIIEKFTYGHYILTALKKSEDLETRDKDYIAAGTLNWAAQVSFSPQMIAVAVGQKSDLNETIDYSGHFTIHLLSDQHRDHVNKFSQKSTIENGKINGVDFEKKHDQAILKDSLGYLVCRVKESMNTGDHRTYFGEVIHEQLNGDEKALCTNHLSLQYTEEKAAI